MLDFGGGVDVGDGDGNKCGDPKLEGVGAGRWG